MYVYVLEGTHTHIYSCVHTHVLKCVCVCVCVCVCGGGEGAMCIYVCDLKIPEYAITKSESLRI